MGNCGENRGPVERLELSESPIFLVNPQVLHSFPPIDTLDVPLRTDIACKAGRAWKNRRRPFGRYSLPWQSVYRCSMHQRAHGFAGPE